MSRNANAAYTGLGTCEECPKDAIGVSERQSTHAKNHHFDSIRTHIYIYILSTTSIYLYYIDMKFWAKKCVNGGIEFTASNIYIYIYHIISIFRRRLYIHTIVRKSTFICSRFSSRRWKVDFNSCKYVRVQLDHVAASDSRKRLSLSSFPYTWYQNQLWKWNFHIWIDRSNGPTPLDTRTQHGLLVPWIAVPRHACSSIWKEMHDVYRSSSLSSFYDRP